MDIATAYLVVVLSVMVGAYAFAAIAGLVGGRPWKKRPLVAFCCLLAVIGLAGMAATTETRYVPAWWRLAAAFLPSVALVAGWAAGLVKLCRESDKK